MKYILLELFSGIGGFRLGLEQSGFQFDKVYFSEIDKYAIANYLYNFKDSENAGAVENVSGTELRNRHPRSRFIITFGWPCQDNSIAGKRKGQVTGTRSFLLTEAVRLIREIQPDYFVAENVKGLYSVNDGKDFRDSLELLSYLDTDDFQYIVEQQLCNSKWVIPQNRERTYFVGYSAKGGWRGILPVTESDFGANERATETTVSSITAGGHSGGHHSGMTLISDSGVNRKPQKRNIAPPMRSNTGAGHGNYIYYGNSQDMKISPIEGNSQTLNAGHYNQPKIATGITIGRSEQFHKENKNNNAFCIDGQGKDGIISNNSIRRLTEVEAERLQMYPDNFTQYGIYDGVVKKIPKTQRYKLLGNAVTVGIVELIGRKIKEKESSLFNNNR